MTRALIHVHTHTHTHRHSVSTRIHRPTHTLHALTLSQEFRQDTHKKRNAPPQFHTSERLISSFIATIWLWHSAHVPAHAGAHHSSTATHTHTRQIWCHVKRLPVCINIREVIFFWGGGVPWQSYLLWWWEYIRRQSICECTEPPSSSESVTWNKHTEAYIGCAQSTLRNELMSVNCESEHQRGAQENIARKKQKHADLKKRLWNVFPVTWKHCHSSVYTLS